MSDTSVVPMSRDELTAWLDGVDLPEIDDTDEVTYEIAMQILQASSPEKLFSPDQVKHAKQLVGIPFIIRELRWRRSTAKEDGTGRYAIMQCVSRDGEAFVASCGGTQVCLQLRRAELEGWLPYCVTVRAMPTSSGFTAFRLETPDNGF